MESGDYEFAEFVENEFGDNEFADQDERAEWGLRGYVCRIATALGVGPESVCCEWERPANGYLALDGRIPGYPERDVALVWDAVHGWAVGFETGSGEDVLMCAYLGGDVLPVPDRVVTFVRDVLAGHPVGRGQARPLDNKNLTARLIHYNHPAEPSSGNTSVLGVRSQL